MRRMRRLSINIDHVATLRQSRGTKYPDPVVAAGVCEVAGADGITFHLREDRRHIQDRDVRLLKEVVSLPLNFEMAMTEEMRRKALEVEPYQVTLVPEKREELTTEGGLEIRRKLESIKFYIDPIKEAGIRVCLFMEPVLSELEVCGGLEVDAIEIHTGHYCDAKSVEEKERHWGWILEACEYVDSMGMGVHAGHGLAEHNIKPLLKIEAIEEFSIGHGIIAKAVFVGLERAVKDMKELLMVGGRV